MNGQAISEKVLDQPMYSAAEASRLVGLSSGRVLRWLKGYAYEYGRELRKQRPVIKRNGSAGTSYASFLDLIDLLFVRDFLEHGLSLQRVRKALDEATEILGVKHFARQSFFTNGRNIYLQVKQKDDADAILELLSGGQWVISPVIEELAQKIEFDRQTELARRWYPQGPDGLIVLDPLVSFGRPSIVGRGIATLNIYDFYLAEKQDIKAVCQWLELNQREVEAAVAFEENLELAA